SLAGNAVFGTTAFTSGAAEARRAALANGGHAFARVGAGHVQELERERCVEDRARGPQPVVERELRVGDCRAGSAHQTLRDLERTLVERVLRNTQRNETEPF